MGQQQQIIWKLHIVLKVQLFREGHKNLRNLPYGLYIYLVNIEIMRKIAQIFVAFSEKLNFMKMPRNRNPFF